MSQPLTNVDSIAHLLKSSNKLDYNLAGHQITQVLDTFLFGAIQPIVCSRWFLDELSQIYAYIGFNARRRYSSVTSRPQVVANLFGMFFMKEDDRYDTYVKTDLERGFQLYLASEWVEVTKDIEWHNIKYLEGSTSSYSYLINLACTLGIEYSKLVPAARYSKSFYKYGIEFKDLIIGKYTKWAAQRAWRDGQRTDVMIDFTDLFKNYVMQVNSALNRYSHHNGALASYLEYHLLSAKTSPDFSHEVGQAYNMNALERKKVLDSGKKLNNLGTAIQDLNEDTTDDLRFEDTIIDHLQNEKINQRLSKVRGIELAFLYKQLPYTLTPEQFWAAQIKNSKVVKQTKE